VAVVFHARGEELRILSGRKNLIVSKRTLPFEDEFARYPFGDVRAAGLRVRDPRRAYAGSNQEEKENQRKGALAAIPGGGCEG
jgi:hypothetical protein